MSTEKPELSAETIAGLKQKHGETLISVETPDKRLLVFKRPSKEIWAYYQDGLTRDKVTKSACFLRLSMDCVVLPPPQETAVIFGEFPGMPTAIAGELSKLAGLSDELDVKKL